MNDKDLFKRNAAEQRGEHHGPPVSEEHPDEGDSHVSESTHAGADDNHHHQGNAERKNVMKSRSTPTLTGLALAIMFFLSQTAFAGNTAFAGDASRGFAGREFLGENFNARNAGGDTNGFFTEGDFNSFNFSRGQFSRSDFAAGDYAGFGFDGNFREGGFKAAFTLNKRGAGRRVNTRNFNKGNFSFAGRVTQNAFDGDGFFGRDFASF